MVGLNSDGPARDRVIHLMAEKDNIESEIRRQTQVLESNNVGMHDSLVDEQGFPRADIDVYKVRHARHSIICLQNDHKALMKRIEQGLADVHAQFLPDRGQGTSNGSTAHLNGTAHTNGHTMNGGRNSGDDVMSFREDDEGFALITFVHEGSPAATAGLCVYDQVLQFGSVNSHNFSDITQVHTVVAHSVGMNVRVIVKRDCNIHCLTVVPRPWDRPGLLGCQIVRRGN